LPALSRLVLSIPAGHADGVGGRSRAVRRRTAARMAVTARSSAGKNSTREVLSGEQPTAAEILRLRAGAGSCLPEALGTSYM